jgi:alginate O-acetyltransferase complex protein AlgJ
VTARRANLLLTVLFAVAVALPGLALLAAHGRADEPFLRFTEQRMPARFPSWSLSALASGGYGRAFESAFGDALPGRSRLLEDYDAIRFSGFGDNTSPDVVRGRDGWLFLAEDRDAREWAARADDGDIAYVANVFRARALWCRAHGSRYVVLIAPDKSTIYSDLLPAGFPQPRPSGMDRVLQALHDRGVPAVDVRPALAAAREGGLAYSRGDTHWTERGAYAAYRATMQVLRPLGIADRVPFDRLRFVDVSRASDLFAKSGVGTLLADRQVDATFPARSHEETLAVDPYASDPDLGQFQRVRTAVEDASLPTAVVFGDSFSWRLQKFFAEDFRHTTYLHYPGTDDGLQFNEHVIAAEHPTIVIQELVERYIRHEWQE